MSPVPPRLLLCASLLVALWPRSAGAQAILNLSHDLVPLGIAASNMVPNQPALDAGPLLMQGVAYANGHGISTVVADPGTYYFLSLLGSNVHVQIANISNITIDFQGSDLIFTRTLFYGIIIGPQATNVTLQNFTVDYQPLPFTQVRVVSVDLAASQIEYSVEPGWQDPSTFNSMQIPPGQSNPNVELHIFRSGRPAFGVRRMLSQRPFSGNRFSVMGYTAPATLSAVRPGDVAVIFVRGNSDAINTNHCIGCTLRNITVFACGCGGGAVGTISAESNVMERIYSIPKPATDRLVSTVSAVAIGYAGPNNQIRLSRAIRTMDDGFWFYGRVVGTVQNQASARTLTVSVSEAGTAFSYGDSVANGSAVAFERKSDGVALGSAVIVSQTAATPAPSQITFTFDRDLPGNLVGSQMYATDPGQTGANSLLERSTVQDQSTCCKGTYFAGYTNSAIRGNYIRRSAFAGIFLLQSMTPGDLPGAPLANVTVANNVVDTTSATSDWWWFHFGAIQTVTLTTAFDLMTGSPFSNINVTNNFIADSGRSAVWIGNTIGGSITGNYVLDANRRPDLANANAAKIADTVLPLVVDTTSSGIAVANNTLDQTSGRVFVTDTQYRELAAYPPNGTIRLNAYNLGALASPSVTLTDADRVTRSLALQNTTAHFIDVQLPVAVGRGGAYVTVAAGGATYFGTLFIDSQDHGPAVNGCTYEASPSSSLAPSSATSVPFLVITQAGCSYQVLAFDNFVTVGGLSTGTAVVSVGFAANSGSLRTTTIEIAGQPFTMRQSGAGDGGTFTDATLSGATVRAVHVTELRNRIDALRGLKGLTPFQWSDPSLVQASTPVRATHVRELRTALNQAYVAAARPVPAYSDAIAAGSTTVKAIHITELRSAVVALEQP